VFYYIIALEYIIIFCRYCLNQFCTAVCLKMFGLQEPLVTQTQLYIHRGHNTLSKFFCAWWIWGQGYASAGCQRTGPSHTVNRQWTGGPVRFCQCWMSENGPIPHRQSAVNRRPGTVLPVLDVRERAHPTNVYFYSTLLYTIFIVSMAPQSRQNMNKWMYLGPFQNKILFQNKFLFYFVLGSNI
jgi:hypothetical protein